MKKIAIPLLVVFSIIACQKEMKKSEMNKDIEAMQANSQHKGRTFSITLTGAAEAPIPGDPDGTGTATITLNPGHRTISYTLTVSGIAPARAAHIHEAPAGIPGPVVVPLMPPTSGTASDMITDVDRELILDIITNPQNYYVNVHNTDFPAGALRGQLK